MTLDPFFVNIVTDYGVLSFAAVSFPYPGMRNNALLGQNGRTN